MDIESKPKFLSLKPLSEELEKLERPDKKFMKASECRKRSKSVEARPMSSIQKSAIELYLIDQNKIFIRTYTNSNNNTLSLMNKFSKYGSIKTISKLESQKRFSYYEIEYYLQCHAHTAAKKLIPTKYNKVSKQTRDKKSSVSDDEIVIKRIEKHDKGLSIGIPDKQIDESIHLASQAYFSKGPRFKFPEHISHEF